MSGPFQFPYTALDWYVAGRTLWGEARGEPRDGQIAVAWAIRNRAESPGWWGRTITEVCQHHAQFSVWLDGDPNRELMVKLTDDSPGLRRALGFVALVLSGDLPDPTDGATHYHTVHPPQSTMDWPPHWAKLMKTTVVIGAHVFLREFRIGEVA